MALTVPDERDAIVDDLGDESPNERGGWLPRLVAPLLEHIVPSSIASFVIGVILVLIAEVGEVHETRIFGAGLITGAGIGFGIATGLADPRKLQIPEWLKHWRSAIGITAAILALAPAVIVLGGVLIGAFGDAEGNRSGAMLALGFIVALLMLLATLITGGISIRAIARAANQPAEQMVSEELGAHVDET